MAAKPKPRPTPRRETPLKPRGSFYDEHIRGREAILLIAVGGVLTFLYWLGIMTEPVAAAFFGGAVILGGTLYGLAKLRQGGANPVLAIGIGLLTIAVAAVPAIETLYPGQPAAHGELRAQGDAVPVPDSAHGPARILLRGRIAGQGAAVASVSLDLDGHGMLHGELTRTLNQTRVGRRGSGTVVHEHNGEYLTAELPNDVHRLVLDRLDGALSGPLEVSVFPERVPLPIEIALGAVLLLICAGIAARIQAPSAAVGGLATAVVFGIMVSRMATPEEAVGPEVGAFLISIVAAAVFAGLSVEILSRVGLRRKATA